MTYGSSWSRYELLVAFALYCRIPFGRLHRRDSEVIKFAGAIGETRWTAHWTLLPGFEAEKR